MYAYLFRLIKNGCFIVHVLHYKKKENMYTCIVKYSTSPYEFKMINFRICLLAAPTKFSGIRIETINYMYMMTEYFTLNEQRVHNVVVHQFKVLMADPVFYIALSPSEEVVHHRDLVTFQHQAVHQVGAHKAGTTRYLYR